MVPTQYLLLIFILNLDTIHPKPYSSDITQFDEAKAIPQTVFLGDLRKLRVRLQEEEPIGTEVANLRFLTQSPAIHTDSKTDSGRSRNGPSHNFQIFNSEPQSQLFYLDGQTGILRVARRIDRDNLCPNFKSCCPYNGPLDFHKHIASSDGSRIPDKLASLKPAGLGELPECHLVLNVRSDDQYTNILVVHVHILDINDNSPMWLLNGKNSRSNKEEDFVKQIESSESDLIWFLNQQTSMTVYVSESSMIGDLVQLNPATDLDAGPNGILKYTIEPEIPEFQLDWTSSDDDYFSQSRINTNLNTDPNSAPIYTIHQTKSPPSPRHELFLIVKKNLDRESKSQFNFNLTVFDGGQISRNSTIVLHVIVTDFNDNSPVFEKESYLVELHENARPHTPIVQVKATDADEGKNGQVKYRFSSLTKAEYIRLFSLDPITGWVHVQWEIDYEMYKQIVLTIEAVDGGNLPRASTCIVDITVLDENDHSPELHFEPPHLTNYALVPENEKPGRLVAVFTAQDRDSGDNGRVTCQLSDPNRWHFETNDRDRFDSIIANPTETFFNLQQMHMPFSVMYKLTTASTFDREFISRITVWIICSDFGKPPRNSTGSVAVRITDLNDEIPRFDRSHYYSNIKENTPIGTVVVRINATDLDEGDNAQLSYWLTGEHSEYVDVDPKTGQIKVAKILDREKMTELRIRMHAADNGNPSLNSSTQITISIQDINDNAPDVLNKMEFYVWENHTASQPIGKISATDKDEGRSAELNFVLIQCLAYIPRSTNRSTEHQDNHQAQFEKLHTLFGTSPNYTRSIDAIYTFFISKEGNIYLGRSKLDREKYPLYELQIIVEDQGIPRLSSTVTVMIHVLDVNDNAPKFIFPSVGNNTIYVPQETAVGTVITRLFATDEDLHENSQISYDFKANEKMGLHELFELNSETGEIKLIRSIKEAITNDDDIKSSAIKHVSIQSNSTSKQRENSNMDLNRTRHLKRFMPQMAYSLIVTATDDGQPKLKSSTVLRILFTPPFYPPNNDDSVDPYRPMKSLPESVIRSSVLNSKGPYHHKDESIRISDYQPAEGELTGFGVLLGLVTAIGLFVCFIILVVMITLHQTARLRKRRKRRPDPSDNPTLSPISISQESGPKPQLSTQPFIPIETLNPDYYIRTTNRMLPQMRPSNLTEYTTV